MKQYGFSKERRIRNNKQFRHVIENGQCVRDDILSVYMLQNEHGFSRLGVSVKKSYGNAVQRNRIKRLVREVFRLNQYEIPGNYDYLVLIKRKIENPSFAMIKESFMHLIVPP